MLTSIFAIIAGFIILVWSADRFVFGAAGLAKTLGMSEIMIGLTVVALGTSAPEIIVSATAAFTGSPSLAIANAIGSNIANIGLVLGLTGLIVTINVSSETMVKDLPAYLAVLVLCCILLFDNRLGFTDGVLLVVALVVYIGWLIHVRNQGNPIKEETPSEASLTIQSATFWFMFGLLAMLASSRILIWGAVSIAQHFDISEAVIGVTIVAIGTSLPELAASITSALKKHHELAVGNIIGSNILNMLAVLSLPALISPGELAEGLLQRDFIVMLALSMLMVIFLFPVPPKLKLTRVKAIVLALSYFGYMTYLAFSEAGMASL